MRKYLKEHQCIALMQGHALTNEQRELWQLRKQIKWLTMERNFLIHKNKVKQCFAPTQDETYALVKLELKGWEFPKLCVTAYNPLTGE